MKKLRRSINKFRTIMYTIGKKYANIYLRDILRDILRIHI